jgi:hypothetical protein
MQSDFKTVEITDVETLQVLSHPVVQNAFRSGGWIAGGFPRLVGRTILRPHRLDSTSSNKSKLFQCYFQNRGDIDFFFRNHDDFASAVTKGLIISLLLLITCGFIIAKAFCQLKYNW